jgi:hypothetical protein
MGNKRDGQGFHQFTVIELADLAEKNLDESSVYDDDHDLYQAICFLIKAIRRQEELK